MIFSFFFFLLLIFKVFKNTLEQDIIDAPNTSSKHIFLALLRADRPEEEEINNDEVLEDARNLYETNSKWQIDGSTFIQLLYNRRFFRKNPSENYFLYF